MNSIDLTPYTTVRLISDGCGGQNKNSILITMMCSWFVHAPDNIKKVQLVFPMTGHSFIPPDRMFGNVEKEIKRREVIVSPQEYIDIIGNFATVKKVGIDTVNFNWKSEVEQQIRKTITWHFGIKSCKRVYCTKDNGSNEKVVVQGECTYRLKANPEQAARSIIKRGRSLNNIRPVTIVKGISVGKEQKKANVNTLLLKHDGSDWRQNETLAFFRHVLDDPEVEVIGDNEQGCQRAEEMPCYQI